MADDTVTTQSNNSDGKTLTIGDWVVDYAERDVLVKGKWAKLTDKEFEIVVYLAERLGQPVNRADLFQAVWGYEMDFNSNSLEVYVYRIRQKVSRPGHRRDQIRTVRSYGYKLVL